MGNALNKQTKNQLHAKLHGLYTSANMYHRLLSKEDTKPDKDHNVKAYKQTDNFLLRKSIPARPI